MALGVLELEPAIQYNTIQYSTKITKTFHFKLLTAAIPFSCPILCSMFFNPKIQEEAHR